MATTAPVAPPDTVGQSLGAISSEAQIYAGVFLLSAATLALEIALTRLFSLTQWYHFAFIAVAVALLGSGASGSLLAVAGPGNSRLRAVLATGAFSASVLALHPAVRAVPFDAYRLAIDPAQIIYLVLYVCVLAAPFLCSGLVVAALLSAMPQRIGPLYGANLAGSGAGCVLALLALPVAGDGGMALLVSALGLLALAALLRQRRALALLFGFVALILLALVPHPPDLFSIQFSQYKALSIISSFQGSRHVFSRSNASSRVDVIEGPAVRAAPGLSLAFQGQIPVQPGMTVDGDGLRMIPASAPADPASAYADYLPTALPFRLRPHARALILQAGPGLDVLVALRQGAQAVTAVEEDPLVVQAARALGASVYGAGVHIVGESGRSFLARSTQQFDIIVISLAESFRAVTSGDFSLSESYMYTTQAFQACYEHLAPDGLLVVTRWAQSPPAEDVRMAALAAAALRKQGVADVAGQVVAFRSLQTLTMIVRRGPFTAGEIAALRRLWDGMSYDAVYYPGMPAAEANRFIILPSTLHHDIFAALLAGAPLPEQPFDISAVSDDRPFFFHFFRWSQVRAVLANLGKMWQPFGGAGYLVLIVLLLVATAAAAVLIVLPLLVRRGPRLGGTHQQRLLGLVCFIALGFGFLFIEIPLIQIYILFLGRPVYATAVVIFALLVFSGLGSALLPHLGPLRRRLLAVLPLVVLLYVPLATSLLPHLMALPFTARLVTAALALAPLGFLLGLPFPWALHVVEDVMPGFVPWAWAANSCASVICSILAAMIAVSAGFTAVLLLAAPAYLVASLAIRRLAILRRGDLVCYTVPTRGDDDG